jgi:hypothetical protein
LRHWTDMGMIFSECPALKELKKCIVQDSWVSYVLWNTALNVFLFFQGRGSQKVVQGTVFIWFSSLHHEKQVIQHWFSKVGCAGPGLLYCL